MPFTFRWLYCKCKAQSTNTSNREIQNISSFDSPSPSCTWQRWWMSESCNPVQGRHPRPLGTWSPAGCSAQANYLVCKRLRQLSSWPPPILLQRAALCICSNPSQPAGQQGCNYSMHKAKYRGKLSLQKAILNLAGIGLIFSIIALSWYVFDLCGKQWFHCTPDIPGYSLLLNTGLLQKSCSS